MTTGGATERGCPLCNDMDDKEDSIPMHIRQRCEVAIAIRTEEMDLPPQGYDEIPKTFGVERAENGQFSTGGETA